jgi:SulP family sulfate permease
MAGTLLLHIGIDLILEGVYDCKSSYTPHASSLLWSPWLTSNSCFILSAHGKFDNLEYAGIWLITIVMTVYGMSAALIAGIIAALSTYAAQSVTHINPIRDMCTASSFRSSSWDRSPQALAILDDDRIGRNKILLIQLQGHVS